MKRIFVREEVCVGCGLCEVCCSVKHSKSKDIIKRARKKLLSEDFGLISFPEQLRRRMLLGN